MMGARIINRQTVTLLRNVEGSAEYQRAYEKSGQAIREFHEAQRAYRAREIGDAEFLRARAVYDKAMAEYDAAYAAEQERAENPTWLVMRDSQFLRELDAPNKRAALKMAKDQYGGKVRVIPREDERFQNPEDPQGAIAGPGKYSAKILPRMGGDYFAEIRTPDGRYVETHRLPGPDSVKAWVEKYVYQGQHDPYDVLPKLTWKPNKTHWGEYSTNFTVKR